MAPREAVQGLLEQEEIGFVQGLLRYSRKFCPLFSAATVFNLGENHFPYVLETGVNFFRVGSCWVFIANTFFSLHQQSVLPCNTDCWCGEKKVLGVNLFIWRSMPLFCMVMA